MQYIKSRQGPTVALVMGHLPVARKISHIFRKTGVLPVLYDNLESFWNAALMDIPTLCVVDIRLMVEGEKALCNHPAVASEELPLVFYHTRECAPLLSSTHALFSLGTLCCFDGDDGLLEGQLKSILRRSNHWGMLQAERDEKAAKAASSERRLEQWVSKGQESREERHYRERLQKVWNAIGRERKEKGDFWSALERGLGVLEEVSVFSAVELSPNGQKLLPPLAAGRLGKNRRYREIPPLWLGKSCDSGIDFLARNMASQVALDLLGGEQFSLLIEGQSLHPEKMVFVRVEDEEFAKKFDWKGLERYLSDIWCYFSLKSFKGVFHGKSSSPLCHPWEFFSLLDRVGFDEVSEDPPSSGWMLINGDFSNLIGVIRQKSPVRFYWEHFFHTFFTRFLEDRATDIPYRLTCMGVGHVGILVPIENGEAFFKDFQSYSQRYPYWRYFEDTEIILAKDTCPTVRMVPLSAEGYLGILEGPRVHANRELGISRGP